VVEVHVVEAGGVLQQVHHAHRVGGFPGVVDGYFRSEFAHLVVEVQLAMLHELQQPCRHKHLGDRAHPKQRVCRYRPLILHIGQTQSAFKQHRIMGYQREEYARHVLLGHDALDGIGELRHGGNWLALGTGRSNRQA
jgi:hypothetical protein